MGFSGWVNYVNMVHEISGETESYILSRMSFARGLMYQNKWLRLRGVMLYRSKATGRKIIL